MAKRLIASGCRLGWRGVDRGMDVLDGGPRAPGGRGGYGCFALVGMAYFKQKDIRLVSEKLTIFPRTDNTSLETSIHWPSEEIFRFEIEVGVYEKFAKNVTVLSGLLLS